MRFKLSQPNPKPKMSRAEITAARAIANGRHLKLAREEIGLSIDKVSERLRVRRSLVLAIDSGFLAELPQRPYIDGHWKAYAALVGTTLPAWDAARDAELLAIEERSEAPSDETKRRSAPLLPMVRLVRVAFAGSGTKARQIALGGTFILFLALVLVKYRDHVPWMNEVSPQAATEIPSADRSLDVHDTQPVMTTKIEPATGSPVPSEASSDASDTSTVLGKLVGTPPQARSILLTAQAEVWVQINIASTGRVFLARLLKAGERQTFSTEPDMVITVGAPRNLTIAIDGQTVPLDAFIRRGSMQRVRVAELVDFVQ